MTGSQSSRLDRAEKYWIKKSIGLYQMQNSRFVGYSSQNRAREQVSLISAYIVLDGAKEADKFLVNIKDKIRNIDRNDIATLDRLWNEVIHATSEADFNKIIAKDIKEYKTYGTSGALAQFIENDAPPIKQTLMDRIVSTYANAKKLGKVIDPKKVLETINIQGELWGKYAYGMTAFGMWNMLRQGASFGQDHLQIKTQTIPAVLGVVPVPHVREIEVARSGKILKFRATGSVFLANQEGGTDAVRIDGHFYRIETFWIFVLWMLFLWGRTEQKEIMDQMMNNLTPTVAGGDLVIDPSILITRVRKIMDVTKYDRSREKPSYDFHKTFPLVTRHIIIPNCYIETLSFEEKVINGKDCVNYSILLRTYTSVRTFDLFEKPSSNTTFIGPSLDKRTNMGRMLEPVINMIWRGINATGIIVKEREWKIRNDLQGNDVTYDISAEDIASTVLLSLAGAMGPRIGIRLSQALQGINLSIPTLTGSLGALF